ncbi:hypothetical protein F4778DRAFT_266128 [Xylariomycetidae sp. FL2044]|nr:hypothetical protein F4778DRAFT_266128 [Xylariomycetidae sp. FL2044]
MHIFRQYQYILGHEFMLTAPTYIIMYICRQQEQKREEKEHKKKTYRRLFGGFLETVFFFFSISHIPTTIFGIRSGLIFGNIPSCLISCVGHRLLLAFCSCFPPYVEVALSGGYTKIPKGPQDQAFLFWTTWKKVDMPFCFRRACGFSLSIIIPVELSLVILLFSRPLVSTQTGWDVSN